MSKKLYVFSGLGADERVFQKLDFTGFSVTFVKWQQPYRNESIEQYAKRLVSQITDSRPVLVGLSFGGMVAIEVAKLIETEKVVLLATAKIYREIPFYYRFFGFLRLHRLLPTGLLKQSNFVTNWFFGATSEFDKNLLKRILSDTDTVFLKWAIDKVVAWRNTHQIQNAIHIHGTNDRILPTRFVNCDVKIQGGGHFMTLNKPEELTEILKQ